MQFSVYLKSQNAFHIGSVAPHSCSRKLADALVLRGIARKVGQNAIQLLRDITWQQAKQLIPKACPILNSPGYHTPAYTYPLSYEFLRTYQR